MLMLLSKPGWTRRRKRIWFFSVHWWRWVIQYLSTRWMEGWCADDEILGSSSIVRHLLSGLDGDRMIPLHSAGFSGTFCVQCYQALRCNFSLPLQIKTIYLFLCFSDFSTSWASHPVEWHHPVNEHNLRISCSLQYLLHLFRTLLDAFTSFTQYSSALFGFFLTCKSSLYLDLAPPWLPRLS